MGGNPVWCTLLSVAGSGTEGDENLLGGIITGLMGRLRGWNSCAFGFRVLLAIEVGLGETNTAVKVGARWWLLSETIWLAFEEATIPAYIEAHAPLSDGSSRG